MLTVYTLEQAERWDTVVRSFKEHDAYWLSGYVKAFQIHGDGEPLLFYYESQNLRGINVVMKRDVAKDPRFAGKLLENEFFDFATPYGYGGWLIEGETDVEELFSAYGAWCAKHSVVSEFVRYHPVLQNHCPTTPVYDVLELGHTISMDLSSPETIWENLTSKNRNMIRKAQKNGIKIYTARNPQIFEVFREIYNGTMDKDHAAQYYYFRPEFYRSVLEDLPEHAQVFYAQLNGEIIAVSIMLTANGRMNYHLSGSKREYQNLAPTNLLLYEAALWGCANGCKTLHLGGGVGSGEDGLYAFKKSFYRKDPHQFHIGRKVWMENRYQELLQIRGSMPESAFFPAYRA